MRYDHSLHRIYVPILRFSLTLTLLQKKRSRVYHCWDLTRWLIIEKSSPFSEDLGVNEIVLGNSRRELVKLHGYIISIYQSWLVKGEATHYTIQVKTMAFDLF